MSKTWTRWCFINSPSALKKACCPTAITVGIACGTRLGVGVGVLCLKVAVGVPAAVAVADLKAPVGTGPGVGVGGIGVPAPITIVVRAKPMPGPGLGHTPAWKFPNASNDPVHPLLPPQLLIITVNATNNTTGATTIHLKRHDIE